jgi:DNA-binding response OmpR family regulator
MNILICEDNPLAVKTVSVVLNREGYKTESAHDGNEAMDLLRKNDYDLIVVDIHLPYISGLELVKYLRSDLGKNTPVLVLTAFSNPRMQIQAKQLGINEYIVKPFNPSDLVSRIRSLVERCKDPILQ